jgi:hypothetical protein
MSSTRSEDLDPETSDRSLTSDVLLRQEPDEEEDEEEDNSKEDDHDDDEEDDGYSEMSLARRQPRSAVEHSSTHVRGTLWTFCSPNRRSSAMAT